MDSLSNDLEKLKDEKVTQRQEKTELEEWNSSWAEKNMQLTREINQLKVGMWRSDVIGMWRPKPEICLCEDRKLFYKHRK